MRFGKSAQRWIIIPDMQVPYHDKASVAAVEAYMAAHRWDGYLNLGDFMDIFELSKYVADKPGAIKGDLQEAFAEGNRILDRHVELTRAQNRKARMVLLQGNHEYRCVDFAQRHPGLQLQLDVERNLRLRERGIEWHESWEKGEPLKLGHAHFLHGRFIGQNHAAKMANAYGVSIYYGHTHDVMLHPRTALGNDTTIEAGSLGCLCEYDQKYLRGAPTNWQQAFGTLFLFPDGFYNIYVTRIFKHRFVGPDGVQYGG